MNPYFICSLPRSRTAWLANFLTYGPSHCFHEPYNQYNLTDLPELFLSANRQYVGISDSLNAFFIKRLMKIFPAAKIILVRRPLAEVDKSLSELGLPCREVLEKLEAALDHIAEYHQPFIVDFHAFSPDGIWNYLMPEVPFNLERARMLETFNITVPKVIFIKKGLEVLQRCSQQITEIFGGEKKN